MLAYLIAEYKIYAGKIMMNSENFPSIVSTFSSPVRWSLIIFMAYLQAHPVPSRGFLSFYAGIKVGVKE